MMTLTVMFFALLAMTGLFDMLLLTTFMAAFRERGAQYMASLAVFLSAMVLHMAALFSLLAMLTLTVMFFTPLAMIGLIDMLFLTTFMAVLRERDAPYTASLAVLSR
eukprot:5041642-Prorocentrum_lima.AAC.1